MELYKKISSGFNKLAASTPLNDNTEVWSNEILAALYKQHQFLGSYEVNLQIDGQEENLGFLYGSFQVRNPGTTVATQHQGLQQGMVTKTPQLDSPAVKIPVIVADGKLSSFDVFIRSDGSFSPLDQRRLEETLFQPSGYSAVSPREAVPNQPGGSPDTMSPAAPSYGRAPAGQEKMASVLEKVASTIPQGVREEFIKTSEKNPFVKRALANNSLFASALHKIASTPFTGPDLEDEVDAAILEKVGGGYRLTHAKAEGFSPKVIELSNFEAQSFPKEAVDACLKNGTALFTYSPDQPTEVQPFDDKLEDVDQTGIYALMEKDGSATRGTVLSDVRRLNGSPSELSLAITPSGASFQEKISGVYCGSVDLHAIQGTAPYGEGVFLLKEGAVTEPLTVKNTLEVNGNVTYLYEDSLGQNGQLKLANVNKITHIDNKDYFLPSEARFIPLRYSSGVMSDKTSIEKVANSSDLSKEVTVVADGGFYSFRGSCVSELPYEEVNFVKESTALLITGLLGASPSAARELLKTASAGDHAKFVALRAITAPTKTKEAENSREFVEFVQGLRTNLIKEAAAMPTATEETLDSVLSLNFITPENIQGFLQAVPVYEQALASLSELLIAVRIGIPDAPEPAVLSCIKSLSRVIDGLSKLGLRQEAQA